MRGVQLAEAALRLVLMPEWLRFLCMVRLITLDVIDVLIIAFI
jgi:hypothetical protein